MLCVLLVKVLHMCYKGTIFVAEIKTKTNLKTKNYGNKNQCSRHYDNDI